MKNLLTEIGTDLLVGIPVVVLLIIAGLAVYVNHALVFAGLALFGSWLIGAEIRASWNRRFNTKG